MAAEVDSSVGTVYFAVGGRTDRALFQEMTLCRLRCSQTLNLRNHHIKCPYTPEKYTSVLPPSLSAPFPPAPILASCV